MFENHGGLFSAGSPEDYNSNLLGAVFGADLDCDSGQPLSSLVEDYFNSLGAKPPQSAPNYMVLPPTESQWQYEWEYHRWLYELRKRAYGNPAGYGPYAPQFYYPPMPPGGQYSDSSSSSSSSGSSSGSSSASGSSGCP